LVFEFVWVFGFGISASCYYKPMTMLLDPTVINLNCGSFGPLPRCVFERVTALRLRQAEEPMDFFFRQLPPLLWQARERLAAFLGGRPERLVFTVNVSVAINMVASSLQLAAPGEILLTDHEYLAMRWCWERAAQRLGLTVRTIALPPLPAHPGEIIDVFRAALNKRTRLAFFSHVLSPTGTVLPVKALCTEARRRGIMTVIDGAHAPAMIPLSLNELECDFYTGNCHKWLLAPTGSAFLYLGAGSENRLQPLQVSWGYHPDPAKLDERDEFGSTPRLRFLEFEATRELCPWLAVPQAIDYQAGMGWQNIRDHNEQLVQHVRHRLGDMPALEARTPVHPELHGFLTAYRLPAHVKAAALRQALWERHRIEVPIVERPDGLLVRVSTHFFNTKAEVDRLAEVLPGCL
jgi:isopenicillin-N epimerase